MEPAGALREGAETTMHTRDGRHHRMRVTEVSPGRSFALRTSPVPLATFTFRCRVDPAIEGSSIQQGVTMSGPMGWLMSAMAGERIAAGFSAVLDGLASAAESAPDS